MNDQKKATHIGAIVLAESNGNRVYTRDAFGEIIDYCTFASGSDFACLSNLGSLITHPENWALSRDSLLELPEAT